MHPCAACGEPSTRKCSGCSAAWYCSEKCQRELWVLHIFDCSPGKPINTAYYLARAVIQDNLPDDAQTCEDYGFERAFTVENRSMLLGLFKGLIIYRDVSPETIHGWRKKGILVEEIKKAFESLPLQARGGYYTWLLQHQWVLDRTVAPPGGDKNLAYQTIARGWQYAGGSSSSTLEEINATKAIWPVNKQQCLAFCTALLSDWHPSPEQGDLWVYFGFCVCPDEWNEKSVFRLYHELIKRCSFNELYTAFDSSSLIALFDSKGLKAERKKILHLEDVLSGSPRVFKSVWKLKQIVFAQGEMMMIPSVAVDYGFVNCRGGTRRLLRGCYRQFFQHYDGDPIKLHEAAIAGKTFECVEAVVKLKKKERKTMQQLMQNPYPLPVFIMPSRSSCYSSRICFKYCISFVVLILAFVLWTGTYSWSS